MEFKNINELIILAKNGNKQALMELFNNYLPFINNFLKTVSNDSYEFEDLKQECYLTLIKCLEKYDDTTYPFTSYYIKSCKNNVYSFIKTNRNICIDHYDFIEDTIDLDSVVVHKLNLDKLKLALAHLKPDERRIIIDYFYNNLSLIEMSAKYNLKYITLVKRKNKVLQKLKKQF